VLQYIQSMNKHILLFFFLFLSGESLAQTKLMMIGGGKRPIDILEKFSKESKEGKILIITWASGDPDTSFKGIQEDFLKVGKSNIVHAPTSPLNEGSTSAFLGLLAECSGIYFTGGDQNRIMKVLEDRSLNQALHEKYKRGYIFGGTSAGTAIMSEIMITGKGDFTIIDQEAVETTQGLGLVKNMIADQHFIKRQRQNRLWSLLLKHPHLYGVGIDEDTALYLENGKKGTVYGDSQIMVIKPKKGKMQVFLHKKGDNIAF
jgi:cyanophycinase